MINIFIADDHLMFRQGLRTLIEKTKEFNIVGEAGVGQEALKKIEQLKPDVAILDIAMPGLNGVEITRRVSKILPQTRILILTMHADRFFAMETLKAGALGYLLKEDSFAQLTDAIKTVSQGKVFVSSAMETSVMKGFVKLAQQAEDKTDSILTEREREILQLITEGMTSHNIADTLCISISTVDTHRKNIMSKLDIHSIAGLVKYAIKHKIVTF